jgi:hypothetical protein
MSSYKSKSTGFILAGALVLAGCGGGGGGSTHPRPGTQEPGGQTPLSATHTGRFVDAPVQGLRYVAGPSENGCATLEAGCVTDADGTFRYNSGDNVTFYLGAVELGQVAARGVVTPQTVAEAVVAVTPNVDVNTVRDNLLVFLQSLDADGDPNNGITITPAIASEVTEPESVDFAALATTFTTQVSQLVNEVKAATGNAKLTVVTHEDARKHFTDQLASNIAGTYAWSDAEGAIDPNNPLRTLTLFRSGAFLFAGFENNANCKEDGSDPLGNGIVNGTYEYDADVGTLKITRSFHNTGDCGLGEGVYEVKHFDGTLLALDDTESAEPAFYFSRVEQSATTVAGSWLWPESVLRHVPEPVVVTFFATSADGKQGRYILADARAENGRGMEYGCYAIAANGSASFNAQNGATCENVADTNGNDGFHGIAAKAFKVDGYGRLELIEAGDDEDDVITFMPLNGGRMDVAHLGGAWYLELAPGADPEAQSEMFVLAVDGKTGNFAFGTQHETGPEADRFECLTPFYSGDAYGSYEDYGNGVELGRWQEKYAGKGMGILMPVIDPAPGGLDTNGDCGVRNAENSGDHFLYRLSPVDPDVLLGWNDGEGFAFRRLRSEDNSVVGLWQHYDHSGEVTEPELSVFFPGGQVMHIMYDAGSDTRDQGIRREHYVINGDTISFNGVGFAYCVDTIDDEYCEKEQDSPAVTLNPERTEGVHGDGIMRKVAQP